jgi:hypothetical protein
MELTLSDPAPSNIDVEVQATTPAKTALSYVDNLMLN